MPISCATPNVFFGPAAKLELENEYADWFCAKNTSYQIEGVRRLKDGAAHDECVTGALDAKELKSARWRLATESKVCAGNLECTPHDVERAPSDAPGRPAQFVPTRFIFPNKLAWHDKLVLAFDALVLSETLGRPVDLGKIQGHLRGNISVHSLSSPVIHIDETTVRLRKQNGYVWVVTRIDKVYYFYKPSREGSFLQEFLGDFTGVLVSDFYTAYDSLKCEQQKCLVHLVRDIDEDVMRNPLDTELKFMA